MQNTRANPLITFALLAVLAALLLFLYFNPKALRNTPPAEIPCGAAKYQAGQKVQVRPEQFTGTVKSYSCNTREGTLYYQVETETEILRYPEGALFPIREEK
jgi:hypothetical protein